ncbi:MAG: glycosyltransferase family 2 protein [Candidatus Uhrbacteria bacterium]|nr:glycosyltransferase family 2 protein [Patescibacteria group bacterium]MBU1906525.1 glycosyltransferase family 2 protein [Patescibacteria group bacterium]
MVTWVVIPAYNEGTKLAEVLRAVLEYVSNVVVVDDGSVDDTYEVAKRTGVSVLRHRINRGQGAALATGIEFALRSGAEAIVTFDSDGQMAASDIPMMLEPIAGGEAEAVLGSRFVKDTVHNMPALRKMIVKGGILFTRILSRIDVTDTHNGFRAFSRAAAKKITINQDRMTHASEILDQISKQKIKFVERPVTITYTDYSMGRANNSNLNAIKIAARMIFSKIF